MSDHVVNSNPTFTVSGVFSDASAPSTPTKTKSEVSNLLAKAGLSGNTRHHSIHTIRNLQTSPEDKR